jgi:hypothetical protein
MSMFQCLTAKGLRLMNFVIGVGPDISAAAALTVFIVLNSNPA